MGLMRTKRHEGKTLALAEKKRKAMNWLRWKLSIPIILIAGKAKRYGWADILLFYGAMALLSAIVLMM
jgi:hypothetical protein